MRHFVPFTKTDDWLPERIAEQLRILGTREDSFQPNSVLRANAYTLIAIVLGTAYRIVSKSCRDGYGHYGRYFLDSEIAFNPNVIYGDRLKVWATRVCLPLMTQISYKEWNIIVLELILGHRPVSNNEWAINDGSTTSQNEQPTTMSSDLLSIGMVLGAQANGLAAVLDLLV